MAGDAGTGHAALPEPCFHSLMQMDCASCWQAAAERMRVRAKRAEAALEARPAPSAIAAIRSLRDDLVCNRPQHAAEESRDADLAECAHCALSYLLALVAAPPEGPGEAQA